LIYKGFFLPFGCRLMKFLPFKSGKPRALALGEPTAN